MPRLKYKKAVGLEVKRGKPPIGKKPDMEDLFRLYVKESRSIRDIAILLGCTKDMVFRALKEYEIARRSNACRSRLRRYSLKDLEEGIRSNGISIYARELGVHENTLRYHMSRGKEEK